MQPRFLPYAASLALLAACTQAPAPVTLRGQENFSRHNAPETGYARSAPVPAYSGTISTAPLPPGPPVTEAPEASVQSRDLAPPPGVAAAKPVSSEPAAPLPAPAATVSATAASAYAWPVHGNITAHFVQDKEGIVIAARPGSPILAAADGEVVYAGQELKSYGTMVVLKHPDGLYSSYAQLEKSDVALRTQVHQGDTLGIAGEKGVHFSLHRGKEALDPEQYLR